ncbi:MAG: hypothetical protein ABIH48_02370 [Candidatus Falkowbacteria bacterium]
MSKKKTFSERMASTKTSDEVDAIHDESMNVAEENLKRFEQKVEKDLKRKRGKNKFKKEVFKMSFKTRNIIFVDLNAFIDLKNGKCDRITAFNDGSGPYIQRVTVSPDELEEIFDSKEAKDFRKEFIKALTPLIEEEQKRTGKEISFGVFQKKHIH